MPNAVKRATCVLEWHTINIGNVMDDNYNDIINLPHHVSKTHPQMSALSRAAQFAPFAALTGYDDAITETARYTETRIELDESRKEELNTQLLYINEHIEDAVPVKITYFTPDKKKDGGSYSEITESIKKIDDVSGMVIFSDERKIRIDDIISIHTESER